MTLEGENQESSRFGSTVVNIGDINGDGTDGKNLNFTLTDISLFIHYSF